MQDFILLHVIMTSILHIAELISKIVNSSFMAPVFSDSLKIAKVCSVFKSGDKTFFQISDQSLYSLVLKKF